MRQISALSRNAFDDDKGNGYARNNDARDEVGYKYENHEVGQGNEDDNRVWSSATKALDAKFLFMD